MPGPSSPPDLEPDGLGPSPDDLGLPPSSDTRLPPWLEAARRRLGLDGRALAWIVAAVAALAVGVWLLRPAPAPVEETLPMASSSAPAADGASAPVPSSSTSSVPSEVVAHAAGAVVHPGVYTLDPTARVDDLVRAAGGLAPDADAARINLAAPLADGARVYVPRIGEGEAPPVVGPEEAAPPGGPDPSAPGADGDAPDALIDLNTASEEELDELPGVGPAIAAAIVAFREENGGFASVDDLLDVRGIGEAKLAEIRPLVTV
ncbi:ComEA family DNA-binding protein [Iamia sp. SCSIO 61187]|uniref:helix-hairpin-helix domain-containing protein n=1 Tax=Iamia sp. SCSIO 61187 TaxID=2722752 RepID=UPI001C62B136|nr:helix-hairpin-helix domain-containing protein [Iamia sp. SCSIO 61187]QYG93717.1 ComEA family DNA-binding protein [Iamia sp. SCSIO 61187]